MWCGAKSVRQLVHTTVAMYFWTLMKRICTYTVRIEEVMCNRVNTSLSEKAVHAYARGEVTRYIIVYRHTTKMKKSD